MPFLRIVNAQEHERRGMVRLANLEIKTIHQTARHVEQIFGVTGQGGVMARHHFVLNKHMMGHRIEVMLLTLISVAEGQTTIGFTNTGLTQVMFLKHEAINTKK
jgi:hypothetical protein